MYRVYQYQSNAMAHIPGEPKTGDWVVQKMDSHGYWRNHSWPYASKELAELDITRFG